MYVLRITDLRLTESVTSWAQDSEGSMVDAGVTSEVMTFALTQGSGFELRYPRLDPRPLPLDQVQELIEVCEQDYFGVNEDDLADLRGMGRRLFHWLDGPEGWLRRIENGRLVLDLTQVREDLALNPETRQVALGLAHLPWELLHDDQGFLLQDLGRSVLPVPVRQVEGARGEVRDPENRALRLLLMATSPLEIEPVLDYEREESNILQATQQQSINLLVEETGSVDQLQELIRQFGQDYFDVFHLTGHGGCRVRRCGFGRIFWRGS